MFVVISQYNYRNIEKKTYSNLNRCLSLMITHYLTRNENGKTKHEEMHH